MFLKKKRSFFSMLRASAVIILFLGVPVWLIVIGLITGSMLVWLFLGGYVGVSYSISGRFDSWVM